MTASKQLPASSDVQHHHPQLLTPVMDELHATPGRGRGRSMDRDRERGRERLVNATTNRVQAIGKHDKVILASLFFCLVCVSLVDLAMDWLNYLDLCDLDLRYGLAIGPPSPSSLFALLFFNIVGSLTFVLELVNSLSLLTNGGHMRLEVEVEQIIVLLVEEIPLAAVNLRVVLCRGDFLTAHQTLAGLTGMLSCVCRLFVYGWVKERRFRFDRTLVSWTLKIAAYISASLLVVVFFALQCIALDKTVSQSTGRLWQDTRSARAGVSVFLLSPSAATIVDERLGRSTSEQQHHMANCSINFAVVRQSLAWDEPWLVRDLGDIARAGDSGLTAYYDCDPFALESPVECADMTRLLIKFVYHPPATATEQTRLPYGQLRYNVAAGSRRRFHGNASSASSTLQATASSSRCQELGAPLAGDWQPLMLEAIVMTSLSGSVSGSRTQDVVVRRPWAGCCERVDVRYDPDMPVCWRAQADEIRNLRL